MVNTPYVKRYDENGVVTNPINGLYPSLGENRKARRSILNKPRFMKNSKGTHLTVTPYGRYIRTMQFVSDDKKVVYHYVLAKSK